MQLAYNTLLKLNNVSKTEMNVFLQFIRYQDKYGKVHGAYYRYFQQKLGFKSKQTFYNVLRSLREKELITYSHTEKGDYDVFVINKTYEQQEKPDYIDLNKEIFQSKEFFVMKAHEKYMLLDLMRSIALNRGIRVIRREEFYQKYERIFGVSRRIIVGYLHTLKEYFVIKLQEGKYYIKLLKKKIFSKPTRIIKGKKGNYTTSCVGKDDKREYDGSVLLRRHILAKMRETDAYDLGKLMDQYRNQIYKSNYTVWEFFEQIMRYLAEEMILFDIKAFHKKLRIALGME